MLPHTLLDTLSHELGLATRQVASALALFDEGNTLPFIARYRKEATGGLDEVQLRDVRDRALYLREMEDRRAAILKSIDEQGKLDDALRARITAVDTKQELEDLYLPFKPRRRTRAMIAAERGLGPLAELLWNGQATDADAERAAVSAASTLAEVDDAVAALQGARDILAERVAEDAEVRGFVRERTRAKGVVRSSAATGKSEEVSKFQDYYDFRAPLSDLPSHRILAIRRGEADGFLVWSIEAPVDELHAALEKRVLAGRAAVAQLTLVVRDAYKRLLAPSIEVELRLELKTRADEDAIAIFGRNLEQLLLAAPAGGQVVIGLDPGFRTGVKVAAISRTGALLATDTWFLHQPDRFSQAFVRLLTQTKAELVAIGNGTASRETESLVKETLAGADADAPRPQVVVVNESGASVYSASDVAREELPDLDVSLRGAVSIARRLQDPLAELVKIDPKSIGVGQYQHDVNQPRLKTRLDDTVQSCVNRVGVEVNTASVSLLSYVAGIGPTLAQNIVRLRDERGGLRSRRELMDVSRLGAKAFEQCAGFLRVRDADNPLDSSAVHPERYATVERIAADLGVRLSAIVGNDTLLDRVELGRYVADDLGLPTLRDILVELRKPGRDPRASFEVASFRDDITRPGDLHPGMVLEGVVTNIVAFGAFVDVGVHQDGLVHVSQLADRYVNDPNQVVRVGQRVQVTVISVDLARNRIALSMKAKSSPDAAGAAGSARAPGERTSPGRGSDGAGGTGGRGRGGRDARSPSTREPASHPAAPRIPRPGEVASNGMRFK